MSLAPYATFSAHFPDIAVNASFPKTTHHTHPRSNGWSWFWLGSASAFVLFAVSSIFYVALVAQDAYANTHASTHANTYTNTQANITDPNGAEQKDYAAYAAANSKKKYTGYFRGFSVGDYVYADFSKNPAKYRLNEVEQSFSPNPPLMDAFLALYAAPYVKESMQSEKKRWVSKPVSVTIEYSVEKVFLEEAGGEVESQIIADAVVNTATGNIRYSEWIKTHQALPEVYRKAIEQSVFEPAVGQLTNAEMGD